MGHAIVAYETEDKKLDINKSTIYTLRRGLHKGGKLPQELLNNEHNFTGGI